MEQDGTSGLARCVVSLDAWFREPVSHCPVIKTHKGEHSLVNIIQLGFQQNGDRYGSWSIRLGLASSMFSTDSRGIFHMKASGCKQKMCCGRAKGRTSEK
jgi:hypothetical protein